MTAPIADLLAPLESLGTFATRLRAAVEGLDGMRGEPFTRDYQGRRGSIPQAGGPA